VRRRLYGSLVALTAALGAAIALGETGEGSLSGWDLVVAFVGVLAMGGIAVLAVVALGFELRAWRRGRRARA
jgi:hypothetical protein